MSFFPGLGYGAGAQFGRGGPGVIDVFQKKYRVFSGAFADKPGIDDGGKTQLNVSYPLLFELRNPVLGKRTHCGVLEFTAPEGHCYVPFWMMELLNVQPGAMIDVRSATLPLGSYVKIRPQTSDFIDISNPRAVLEAKLRNYSCLTKGDTIMINYNKKKYFIDIVDVQVGKRSVDAVCIVETDIQVDFDRPADRPPSPKRKTREELELEQEELQHKQFQEAIAARQKAEEVRKAGGGNGDSASSADPAKPSFQAFVGSGKRLDGKAAPTPSSSAPPSGLAQALAQQQSLASVSKLPPRTLSGKPVPAESIFSQQPAPQPSASIFSSSSSTPPLSSSPAGNGNGNGNGAPGRKIAAGRVTPPVASSPPMGTTPPLGPLVFGRANPSAAPAAPVAFSGNGKSVEAQGKMPAGATPAAPSSAPKKEEPTPEKKFNAFAGQGRSLK